jgi:hypothetical protein
MSALRWWIAGYCVLVAAILFAMVSVRNRVLQSAAANGSVGNWQAWREDVARQQSSPGPVQRRIPESSEPPALVLMRDHFAVSLAGALIFSTALYWVLAWFISGTLR